MSDIDDTKVLQFPGGSSESSPPARGDRMLAALIIIASGCAPLGQIAVYLLAAIGVVSLFWR